MTAVINFIRGVRKNEIKKEGEFLSSLRI